MATRTVTADGDDALAAAVKETEAEIFADATNTDEPENTGDKSLEETGEGLEGEQVDDPEQTETETEGEEKPDDERPRDEEGKFIAADEKPEKPVVPSGRLRDETARAQKAEAALAAKDQQFADLQRQLDALKAGLTARTPQDQQQQKAEPPDMFADPDGWARYQRAQIQNEFSTRMVESSLSDAADTHGEKFQSAYSELQRTGAAEKLQYGSSPTVSRIWNDANPGKALMRWHAQQLTVREVGNDPQAWLDKKLEERLNDPEFLAKAIEKGKLNAQQGDNGRPRTTTRMPPSLNSQTGRTHQEADPDLYDNSERAVFDFATR